MKKIFILLLLLLNTSLFAQSWKKEYESVEKMEKVLGHDSLFIVYKDYNNKGICDEKGKLILPLMYDYIGISTFNDYIYVDKKDEKSIINLKNETIFKVDYEQCTPAYKAFVVRKNDQYAVLDEKGKIIFPFEPNFIDVGDNGMINIPDFNNNKTYVYFYNGKKIEFETYYRETQSGNKPYLFLQPRGQKIGLYDAEGSLVMPLDYKRVNGFNNTKSADVLKDSLYGIIDITGKVILPFEYDLIQRIEHYKPFDNFYLVTKNKKTGIFDVSGKQILPLEYDEISFINEIPNAYIVAKNGKYGLQKINGKMQIPYEYDNLKFWYFNKKIYLEATKNKKSGIVDLDNKTIIPFEYDSEDYYNLGEFRWQNNYYIFAKKNKKMGIITTDNQVVIPFEYDRIDTYGSFKTDSLLYVYKGEKGGLVNPKNEMILPYILEEGSKVKFLDSIIYCSNTEGKYAAFNNKGNQKTSYIFDENAIDYIFKYHNTASDNDGKYFVKHNGKGAYFDPRKGVLLTDFYDDISFDYPSKIYTVRDNKMYGALNESYKVIIPVAYEYLSIGEIYGKSVFIAKKNKKYGIISSENKPILDFEYDYIERPFASCQRCEPFIICTLNDKQGMIRLNKKEILPFQYKYISGHNNTFRISAFKQISGNNTKSIELYGISDSTGKIIIPMIYTDLNSFGDSLYIVKNENGKSGVLNKKNQTILDITYDKIELFNNMLLVNNSNKKGLFYSNGKQYLPIEYDDIKRVYPNLVLSKGGVTTLINPEDKNNNKVLDYEKMEQIDDYYKVKKNGKYGILDKTYNILLPVEYDAVDYDRYEPIWLVMKNGKHGLFNIETKTLITSLKYSRINSFLYQSDKKYLFLAAQGKYFGLLNHEGKEVLPFEYEEIENRYTDDRSVKVFKSNKYGVVDRYGKIIVPVIFDRIGRNVDDSNIEVYRKDVKLHYNLYSNKTIYPNSADIERFGAFKAMPNFGYGNILCVSIDEMFGFMTMDRNILQYPVYQSVREFEKGHFLVGIQKNNQWGVYNLKTKREVMTPVYDDIDLNAAIGFVLLKKGEKWAYANENGDLQSEFEHDSKDFFNAIKEKNAKKVAFQPLTPKTTQGGKLVFDNLYTMKEEGLAPYKVGAVYGYCNLKGEVVIPPTFTDALAFIDGLAIVEKGGKYGVIDTKGNVIVPYQYYRIYWEKNKVLRVEKDGNYALITTDNKAILKSPMSYIGAFSDGLACFKRTPTEKYGYMDYNGKEVIPPTYDNAHKFENGIAEVYLEAKGGTGFIDTKGTLIIPHQYKKNDNNYTIDNSSNLLTVWDKNNKVMLINRKGEKVVDETRDYVSFTPFRNGVAFARKSYYSNEGDWIDTLGNVLPIWKNYHGTIENFSENIIVFNDEYINRKGEKIGVPFQSAQVFVNGFAAAKINNRCGFIDTLGNPLTAFVYDNVSNFTKEGFAAVQIGSYGYVINTKGECVLNCLENPIRLQNNSANTYFTADLNSKILNFVPFQKNKKWGYMMRGTKEIIVPAIMDSCAFAKTNEIYFVDKGVAYTIDHLFGFSLEADGYSIEEDNNFTVHGRQGAKSGGTGLPMVIRQEEMRSDVNEIILPDDIGIDTSPNNNVKNSSVNLIDGNLIERLENTSAAVEKDKKIGIVDAFNRIVIPHQYDKFIALHKANLHHSLLDNDSIKTFYYYLFEKNGERFYVDENGVEYR